MTTQEPPQQLSVSQLNRLAKQLLEDCFAQVSVTGELSTLSRPSSGHWYFTLKDERAQIRCAFFRNRNMRVNFQPQPGQQVVVRGKVSLYEGRGDYQLIVEHMQPAGAGALAAAFEALKAELQAAGWFDPALKKPLPPAIKHIAIITSPTGAALQDIVAVLNRRWPAMKVTLLPVLVQGEQAAGQIQRAIAQANQLARSASHNFDLILLTRGGGSLEDLWPFNERVVAEAIYQSELLVVSAVGHEVDFSIADFVADVRAATPSAAAELLSPDQSEINSKVQLLRGRLVRAQRRRLQHQREQLQQLNRRIRDPRSRLREQAQRLDELEMRLRRQWQSSQRQRLARLAGLQQQMLLLSPDRQQATRLNALTQLQARLQRSVQEQMRRRAQQLQALQSQLRQLGPEQTLSRGYAIVLDQQGRAVRRAADLQQGQRLRGRFAEGQVALTVDDSE
ncbi:MAG: exodeoxyribonuclease VII large subunit [Spongiibacter sp.]|uniref:exodeoxyribonuclease VII large subunit n=1 Tax=Spongiibacter sp. TaxID=2024860 RepID=UPI000C0B2E6A|nr:exodeoxyribonuclease VII large subunit [Spongiibacter sp.]MAK43609.1 exodeoxyribonuclease VII large subunit [Spongiibacter sp.]|tara:strand:+ start:499 stop:1848 length:1350 start_codon:yes stop_codon:yes gene_type:complete